ncbi:MAG TPA: mismatch repair protein [Candidatus Dormibacteraeota bacterium]|nr:mismatch repair protein [Candidatus Dormibacteraeota bacterium]
MPDPRAEYVRRLGSLTQRIAALNRRHIYLGNAKLAAIVTGCTSLWLVVAKSMFAPYWLIPPAAVYLALAIAHEAILRTKKKAEIAGDFYRRGIARIEDRWSGTGATGENFRERNYLYADDLDIFGKGSLFQLLSQARLPMGEDQLAEWLCSPSQLPEILERQNLVAELRENLDLREHLAIITEGLWARLDPRTLISWAEADPSLPGGTPKGIWRATALAFSLATASAILFYLITREYIPLLIVLPVGAVFRRWLQARAEKVMHGTACNAEGLLLFAQALKRLERQSFASAKLAAMSALLRGEANSAAVPASQAIRKLANIVYWIDSADSLLGRILEWPVLYSIQVGYATEAWRRRWGHELRTWASITGEMEALLSLAGYAYEHPADPFPKFLDAQNHGAEFHGEELGHPLIAATNCVRNSVSLDQETRVLLVSGSNMSGKSTYLRTVGINTVLAMAGAPIRGKSLHLTPLALGTRIRGGDSLQEGRSNFYTEILHIRRVFTLLKESKYPLLFLFDELLEGTNSKDRRIGAQGLLEGLLKNGAIGIITTHDLALTEIGTAIGAPLRNMHFEDQVRDGKMVFDYRLREGMVTKSNALELMRIVGLEM